MTRRCVSRAFQGYTMTPPRPRGLFQRVRDGHLDHPRKKTDGFLANQEAVSLRLHSLTTSSATPFPFCTCSSPMMVSNAFSRQ